MVSIHSHRRWHNGDKEVRLGDTGWMAGVRDLRNKIIGDSDAHIRGDAGDLPPGEIVRPGGKAGELEARDQKKGWVPPNTCSCGRVGRVGVVGIGLQTGADAVAGQLVAGQSGQEIWKNTGLQFRQTGAAGIDDRIFSAPVKRAPGKLISGAGALGIWLVPGPPM